MVMRHLVSTWEFLFITMNFIAVQGTAGGSAHIAKEKMMAAFYLIHYKCYLECASEYINMAFVSSLIIGNMFHMPLMFDLGRRGKAIALFAEVASEIQTAVKLYMPITFRQNK